MPGKKIMHFTKHTQCANEQYIKLMVFDPLTVFEPIMLALSQPCQVVRSLWSAQAVLAL
jgi:hypothetical protein